MNSTYSAYGLQISTDVPIPGLIESAADNPDLKIWLSSKPAWLADCAQAAETLCYASPAEQPGGKPVFAVSSLAEGAFFRLTYCDGTSFHVDRSATRIWATWPDPLTLEDAATYLLGPVLGFVLRLRDVTCLHASVVRIDAQAIALMGPPAAGKSTTAAAFARRGFLVLSDDVAPLLEQSGTILVRPGYPRVCLWPESVHSLYGSREALPRLTPNWEKRYLPLEEIRPPVQPLPLGVIYLLGERSAGPRAPFVEPVAARDALMALVGNTYMNYLLDKERRAREFEFLGRLLERIPLRRVTPHSDPACLPKLCDVLVEDFQSLRPGAFAATPAGAQ